jgi:hypothetical protein
MSDDQKKHLEFVQASISRMAGNSFMIRGWSLTLVSALFALAAKDANQWYVIISFFPCLMFWALDAYYLSQERKFRSLYDVIRVKSDTDFSMDTRPVAKPYDSWFRALISKTVLLFHGVALGVIGLVVIVLIAKAIFGDDS